MFRLVVRADRQDRHVPGHPRPELLEPFQDEGQCLLVVDDERREVRVLAEQLLYRLGHPGRVRLGGRPHLAQLVLPQDAQHPLPRPQGVAGLPGEGVGGLAEQADVPVAEVEQVPYAHGSGRREVEVDVHEALAVVRGADEDHRALQRAEDRQARVVHVEQEPRRPGGVGTQRQPQGASGGQRLRPARRRRDHRPRGAHELAHLRRAGELDERTGGRRSPQRLHAHPRREQGEPVGHRRSRAAPPTSGRPAANAASRASARTPAAAGPPNRPSATPG
ncbi:hypothetical protein GA0115257_1185154 [Streptomyces sp. LcepLS]|nr:hypothetical protein GA0115257_1185154 [Streptomyces sp. LcepLS]